MNFEDRLRGHLQQQNDDMTVRPVGPNAVAGRSAARRRRRAIGIPAAVLMLAGIAGGGFWATQNDGTESVAIVADEDDLAVDDTVSDDSAAPAEAEVAQGNQAAGTGFGVGPALTFENIATENSPSGWAPNYLAEDGGIYYILSTAPGKVDFNGSNYEYQRPNTFYTYDGDWSVNEVKDFFVSDFDASDGVIYAVSTGTNDTTAISFGSSSDKGGSWNWRPLPAGDFTEEEIKEMSVHVAGSGESQMVVASQPSYVLHAEVEKLAAASGMQIPAHSIAYVNDTEFGYYDFEEQEFSPDFSQMEPCQAAESQYWASIYEEREQTLVSDFDGDFAYDEAAAEAAQAEYQADLAGMYDALEAAGCGDKVVCRKARDNFYNDPANEVALPADPPGPNATEEDVVAFSDAMDAAQEEMELAYEQQQDELDQILIDAGCGQEVVCQNLTGSVYSEPPFTPPFEPPTGGYVDYDSLTEDELAELDRQWDEFERQSQEWFESSRPAQAKALVLVAQEMEREGCNKDMFPHLDPEMLAIAEDLGLDIPETLLAQGMPIAEMEGPPDVIVVPWAELGVTSPTVGRARVLINRIAGDEVSTTQQDLRGDVVAADYRNGEFEVITIDHANFDAQTNPFTRWASTDGQSWSEEPAPYFDFQPGRNDGVNGQRFRIDWNYESHDGSAELMRSTDGGVTWEALDLNELVPDLGNVQPSMIGVGPFGVIVTAHETSRFRPPTSVTYLYSPDGYNWSASEVESLGYHSMVGEDSVLILGTPEIGPRGSNPDEPSPVLLGRLGG